MSISQDLKQRVVGAAVITALAAIFVPMLLDDPVVERGKVLNEIPIPQPPQIQEAKTEPVERFEPLPISQTSPVPAIEELKQITDKNIGLAKTPTANAKPLKKLTDDAPQRTGEKITDSSTRKGLSPAEETIADNAQLEKPDTDVMVQESAALERKVKAKALAEKTAAEEYRKLAAKKAKEKLLAEKRAAEKALAEEKLIAKQEVLNDKAAADKIAADKKATEKALTEKKTDAAPAAARWFVRMGSFSKEGNAKALMEKLRAQGHPAVVDVVTTAGKAKLYRLRVGPELSKERAEKNRQRLDAEHGSSSILELE